MDPNRGASGRVGHAERSEFERGLLHGRCQCRLRTRSSADCTIQPTAQTFGMHIQLPGGAPRVGGVGRRLLAGSLVCGLSEVYGGGRRCIADGVPGRGSYALYEMVSAAAAFRKLVPAGFAFAVLSLSAWTVPAGAESVAGEEQQGARVLHAVEDGKRACADLSSQDFERVGEYAMGRLAGSTSAHRWAAWPAGVAPP